MYKPIANPRLLSLDVLRGITIAGMILVNNPGSWSYVYAPLRHASWDGLTPTDLVFPFFMFVMGVSMFFSYQKFDFQFSGKTCIKLIRRSAFLFLIGLTIAWCSMSIRQFNALSGENLSFLTRLWNAISDLQNLRIMGVLQRLALVSFVGSLVILLVRHKYIPWIIGCLLLFYTLLLACTDSLGATENNLICIIDQQILGASHMYKEWMPDGSTIAFDPEGLLSTLPCIAHVLLGFWVGKLISGSGNRKDSIQIVFIVGTIILFAGLLLQYAFPINKKIWSSSFVLTTCGFASLLLALLMWIIDVKGHKRWSVFFESFGVNPMFIYVMAAFFSILLNQTGVSGYLYQHVLSPVFGLYGGSLFFALLFVGFNWLIGHILYVRKIYIKL